MRERLVEIGRILRGDNLTMWGKRALIAGAFAGSAIGGFFVWELAVVAWALLLVLVGERWIHLDTNDGCSEGHRRVYVAPSGETEVAICHNCEAWAIKIRSDDRGSGRGIKSFRKRLTRLAETHQPNLPVVAGELRDLLGVLEGVDDLGSELAEAMEDAGAKEGPPQPQGGGDIGRLLGVEGDREQVEGAVNELMGKITAAVEGGQNISEAFVGDNEDAEGLAVIVRGEQFRRFLKWCEREDEDPGVVGGFKVERTGGKASEDAPVACQDCAQAVGEDHLATCPRRAEGEEKVTPEHARASDVR